MGRRYGIRDSRDREYCPPQIDATRQNKVRLPAMVPPEIHELAHANAKAAGMTASRYVAELIARDQLDDEGVPLWAPVEQEELPMTG